MKRNLVVIIAIAVALAIVIPTSYLVILEKPFDALPAINTDNKTNTYTWTANFDNSTSSDPMAIFHLDSNSTFWEKGYKNSTLKTELTLWVYYLSLDHSLVFGSYLNVSGNMYLSHLPSLVHVLYTSSEPIGGFLPFGIFQTVNVSSNLSSYHNDSTIYSVALLNQSNYSSAGTYHFFFGGESNNEVLLTRDNAPFDLLVSVSLDGLSKPVYADILLNLTDTGNRFMNAASTTVNEQTTNSGEVRTEFAGNSHNSETTPISMSGFTPTNSGLGSTVPDTPVGVEYYVPVTITNSQSQSTENPFNQMVSVDSNSFSNYESPNLGNVMWFTMTGSIVPSWIESGDSNSATNTVYWLLIPETLGGNSNIVIFMGFASTSTSLFSSSGAEGVAPKLTSTYGQYDNGGSVFKFYDDFSGNNYNAANWEVITSGSGKYVVNNGITLSENNYRTDMRLVSTSTYTGTVDALVTSQNMGSFRGTGLEMATMLPTTSGFQTGYRFYASDNHPVGTVGGFLDADISGSGTNVAHNSNNPPGSPYIMTVYWPQTGSEGWQNNYGSYLAATDTTISLSHYYVSLYAGSDGSNIGTIAFEWVRVRSDLPSNVMPSTSIGSVESAPYHSNGYLGTDNVYLTTFYSSTNSYIFTNESGYAGAQDNTGYFGKSNTINDYNGISLATGWDESSGSTNPNSAGYLYSSNVQVFGQGPGIDVVVPVTLTGKSFSTNNACPLGWQYADPVSAWNVNLSSWIYPDSTNGLSAGPNGINLGSEEEYIYDAAVNVSNLDYSDPFSNTADSALWDGIASTAATALDIAAIPFPEVAIPAIVLDGLLAADDFYKVASYVPPTNGWLSEVPGYDTIYHNYGTLNGTSTGSLSDYSFSNIYAMHEKFVYFISQNDFNEGGVIAIYANSVISAENEPSQGTSSGASALLTIQVLPAGTIFGKVTEGGQAMGAGVPILMTASNGTQYIVYTVSDGSYSFAGKQGDTYSIQAITPSGDTTAVTVTIPAGDYGTITAATIYLSGPPVYTVVFSESGLPSGAQWSATLNGQSNSNSAVASICFYNIYGSNSYSIPSVTYGTLGGQPVVWIPSPDSGTFDVTGPTTVDISFQPLSSVSGGTEILLSNGSYLPADELANGMLVEVFNTTLGEMSIGVIQHIYTDIHTSMYTINGELNVSPDQMLRTGEKWVQVQSLWKGEKVFNPVNGREIIIHSISVKSGNFTMYGFDLSNCNDFITWQYLLYGQ